MLCQHLANIVQEKPRASIEQKDKIVWNNDIVHAYWIWLIFPFSLDCFYFSCSCIYHLSIIFAVSYSGLEKLGFLVHESPCSSKQVQENVVCLKILFTLRLSEVHVFTSSCTSCTKWSILLERWISTIKFCNFLT